MPRRIRKTRRHQKRPTEYVTNGQINRVRRYFNQANAFREPFVELLKRAAYLENFADEYCRLCDQVNSGFLRLRKQNRVNQELIEKVMRHKGWTREQVNQPIPTNDRRRLNSMTKGTSMHNQHDNTAAALQNEIDHADKPVSSPGTRVLLDDFAAPSCGVTEYIGIAETIHAQMGFINVSNPAILIAWVTQGKYRFGGLLVNLDHDLTTDHGDLFSVSYHYGWDEYTITYAKRDGEHAVIINESEHIQADQLCTLFTEITGIEIPVVAFG